MTQQPTPTGPADPYQWLHDNDFSWDDVNGIAAILDAGGFEITSAARIRGTAPAAPPVAGCIECGGSGIVIEDDGRERSWCDNCAPPVAARSFGGAGSESVRRGSDVPQPSRLATGRAVSDPAPSVCSECGAELLGGEIVEHHEDGSHTAAALRAPASQGIEEGLREALDRALATKTSIRDGSPSGRFVVDWHPVVEARAALRAPASQGIEEGLREAWVAAEAVGRAKAQDEAAKVIAAIVAATGGEVRVPDRLLVDTVTMHTDYLNGETVYRAALRRAADAGEAARDG